MHFERRHNHMLRNHSEARCVGDMCDILRCPQWAKEQKKQRKKASRAPRLCVPEQLTARRHACQGLVAQCVPPSLPGESANASRVLRAALNRTLCAPLTCEWREKCYTSSLLGGRLPDDCDQPTDRSSGAVIGYVILGITITVMVFGVICITMGCLEDDAVEPREDPYKRPPDRADSYGACAATAWPCTRARASPRCVSHRCLPLARRRCGGASLEPAPAGRRRATLPRKRARAHRTHSTRLPCSGRPLAGANHARGSR